MVSFLTGRWQKERDELRKERQDAPAGAGPSKPAGFGKPKAPPPRPPKLLDILVYPDPRLRAENKPVTVFDAELQQLAKDMFHTMYRRAVCCPPGDPQPCVVGWHKRFLPSHKSASLTRFVAGAGRTASALQRRRSGPTSG